MLNKVEKMQLQGVIKNTDESNPRSNDKRDGKSIKANMKNRKKPE